MTLHEALTIKAACDPDKDDCGQCSLSGEIWLDVGEIGHFKTTPCALLLGAEMAVLSLKSPILI